MSTWKAAPARPILESCATSTKHNLLSYLLLAAPPIINPLSSSSNHRNTVHNMRHVVKIMSDERRATAPLPQCDDPRKSHFTRNGTQYLSISGTIWDHNGPLSGPIINVTADETLRSSRDFCACDTWREQRCAMPPFQHPSHHFKNKDHHEPLWCLPTIRAKRPEDCFQTTTNSLNQVESCPMMSTLTAASKLRAADEMLQVSAHLYNMEKWKSKAHPSG